jgi:hypothetical protein
LILAHQQVERFGPFFRVEGFRHLVNNQHFYLHTDFSFNSAGMTDSARPAECREELNAAKPIDPSGDGQRIVLMKNCIHAPTLAQAEESN